MFGCRPPVMRLQGVGGVAVKAAWWSRTGRLGATREPRASKCVRGPARTRGALYGEAIEADTDAIAAQHGSGGCWGSTCSALLGSLRAPGSRGEGLSRLSHLTPVVGHVPQNLISQLEERIELYTHRQRFLPSARDGGLFERPSPARSWRPDCGRRSARVDSWACSMVPRLDSGPGGSRAAHW